MYENIVVGFDNSEYSKAAVIEASNLAKRSGGNCSLAHAVYFNEEEFGITPDRVDERYDFGRNACQQTRDMVASKFGIDLDVRIGLGEAPEVVTNIAREKKADLIVMGTNDRKGLRRLFMGSVTSTVLCKSACDVLMVKKPGTECTGTYSSILLPFDGSKDSRNALKKAAQISKVNGCTITVLYVIPRRLFGFLKTESAEKSLKLQAEKVLETAKEIAATEGIHIRTEIREGAADDQIVKTADSLKSDLIVMGTTYGGWGFHKAVLGSTTKRVMVQASCPVLSVADSTNQSWEKGDKKRVMTQASCPILVVG